MVKSSSGRAGYRSFTVESVSKVNGCETKFRGGRYINKRPEGAARKAFNELCRVKRIKGQCALYLKMKETTKGGSGKVFIYKLNRNKLAKPLVMLKGKKNEYVIEYKLACNAAKAMPTKCEKSKKSSGRMKKRTAKAFRYPGFYAKKTRTGKKY